MDFFFFNQISYSKELDFFYAIGSIKMQVFSLIDTYVDLSRSRADCSHRPAAS